MIETYGVKYLGSKNLLNEYIINIIKEDCKNVKTFIDVFTGTTRVAQAVRNILKIPVITSDLSWASESYAYTFVHNKLNIHLLDKIKYLNSLEGVDGWITQNYCDVLSKPNKQGKRTLVRFWQRENGKRADAIRDAIEDMDLEHWEKMTLITSLIFALDKVDNTTGVQQACLKNWCKRSYNDLKLELLPPVSNAQAYAYNGAFDMDDIMREALPIGQHFTQDVLEIDFPQADVAYLDPPYSPHEYSTYYHIWDSIVKWDKPEVDLATNRRVDRCSHREEYSDDMKSPWNSKKTALDAFKNLIDRLPVRYILLSYGSDSKVVDQRDLVEFCMHFRKVQIERIDYTRNIMHKIGNLKAQTEIIGKNQELLILIEK